MEWSVTTIFLGIIVPMVFFDQHLDHFKVAIAAWEQDKSNCYLPLCDTTRYHIVVNFWGKAFTSFEVLRLFMKIFSSKLDGEASFGSTTEQLSCKTFIHVNLIFHQFAKVSHYTVCRHFPLMLACYCYTAVETATALIIQLLVFSHSLGSRKTQ